MTGEDVKRQVMEALESVYPIDPQSQCHSQAHFALAPCTVLTPEEAAQAVGAIDAMSQSAGTSPRIQAVRALLSPDEAGDD